MIRNFLYQKTYWKSMYIFLLKKLFNSQHNMYNIASIM